MGAGAQISNGMRSVIVSIAEIVSSMLNDSKQEFLKMSSYITPAPSANVGS
jgi:hypothetical protein